MSLIVKKTNNLGAIYLGNIEAA